jgi:hypothetical protein
MLTSKQLRKILSALGARHGELELNKSVVQTTFDHLEVYCHEYAHLQTLGYHLDDYKVERYATMTYLVNAHVLNLSMRAADHNEIMTNAVVYLAFRGLVPGASLAVLEEMCNYNILSSRGYTSYTGCGDKLRKAIRMPKTKKLAKQLRAELISLL